MERNTLGMEEVMRWIDLASLLIVLVGVIAGFGFLISVILRSTPPPLPKKQARQRQPILRRGNLTIQVSEPPTTTSPDRNVEAIRQRLLERSEVGLRKYGVTTERTDLELTDWFRHTQEELLDAAVYIEALLSRMDRKGKRDAADTI